MDSATPKQFALRTPFYVDDDNEGRLMVWGPTIDGSGDEVGILICANAEVADEMACVFNLVWQAATYHQTSPALKAEFDRKYRDHGYGPTDVADILANMFIRGVIPDPNSFSFSVN